MHSFSYSALNQVLKTHPTTLVRGKLYQNCFWIPPETYLMTKGWDKQKKSFENKIEMLNQYWKAQNALESGERKFESLFQEMVQGVILLGHDGTVEEINPAALHIFGVETLDELTDLRTGWVDHAGVPISFQDHPITKGLATQKPTGDCVVGIVSKCDDKLRWLHVTTSPIFIPQLNVSDFSSSHLSLTLDRTEDFKLFVTLQDMTEELLRKETEEKVRIAEEANRGKTTFVASISHEIRTPMNAILGMTNLGLDSFEEGYENLDEVVELLSDINTAAGSLLQMIDHILDSSKIEANAIILENIEFSLTETLETAFDNLGHLGQKKGLEMICDIDPSVPDSLRGDPGRIRQIVLNLVQNAIHFTENGCIILRATIGDLPEMPTDRVPISFEITDTGIGIPKVRQDAVFESFTQADVSTTRQFGGTGLGLTICQRLVSLMPDGYIRLESPSKNPIAESIGTSGTSFFWGATFELASPSASVPSRNTFELNKDLLLSFSVLIIDDFWGHSQIVFSHLQSLDFNVQLVQPQEALSLISEREPAFRMIILADSISDEPNSGFGLCRQIQEEFNGLIVMLVNKGTPNHVQKRVVQLTKPIKKSSLVKVMHQALGDALPESKPTLKPNQPACSWDILVAEDNFLNQKVIQRLLEKEGCTVTVVDNGLQARDVVQSHVGKFNVIFMDLCMPEMDGFEATRVIREMEKETGRHTH